MANVALGETLRDKPDFLTQADISSGNYQDQTLQTDWIYRYEVPINQEIILKPNDRFGIYLKRLDTPLDGCFTKDDTAYVWEGLDANDTDANDVELMPATEVVTVDGTLFGWRFPFTALKLTIGTAGVGSGGTVSWNYWNSVGAWTVCPGISDGTTNLLAVAGTNNVTWRYPSDWIQYKVNGLTMYWINMIVTVANYTTIPLLTQAFIGAAAEFDNPDHVKIQIRNADGSKAHNILDCMYHQCKDLTDESKRMSLSLPNEYRVRGGQWIYIIPEGHGGLVDVSECYFNLEVNRIRATMYAQV